MHGEQPAPMSFKSLVWIALLRAKASGDKDTPRRRRNFRSCRQEAIASSSMVDSKANIATPCKNLTGLMDSASACSDNESSASDSPSLQHIAAFTPVGR